MIQLNAVGRDAPRASGGAHGLTDVTGYGLAGHASEMAEGAGLTVEIDVTAPPIIEAARPLAISRYYTRASKSNREFLEGRLRIEPGADPTGVEFAFDAQTSGGLLIAIDPAHVNRLVAELTNRGASAAAIVGRIAERQGDFAVVLRRGTALSCRSRMSSGSPPPTPPLRTSTTEGQSLRCGRDRARSRRSAPLAPGKFPPCRFP